MDGLFYFELLYLNIKDVVGVNIWNLVKSKNCNFFLSIFVIYSYILI